jgi:hypothetical protein
LRAHLSSVGLREGVGHRDVRWVFVVLWVRVSGRSIDNQQINFGNKKSDESRFVLLVVRERRSVDVEQGRHCRSMG